jgi:dTDP-4-dehydrorhamnose reductase
MVEKIKKIKILILGANGMLGQEVSKVFFDATKWDIDNLDVTNEKQVLDKITNIKPELVINCAAYTNVDGCEDKKELCFKINGEAVGYIAKACENINAKLIHFSTDYVFDGSKKGYNEDDKQNPINVYGESKYLGEKRLIENCKKHYLVRLSWLFGKQGKNFAETILKIANEKPFLEVVNDQVGNPTYAVDVAAKLKEILEKPYGIYHLTNSGSCSWYDFAKEIFRLAKINKEIRPISSAQLNRKAKRPKYSILNNNKLEEMRSWQEALKAYMEERK